MTLEQRKQELLAELEKIEQEIQAARPAFKTTKHGGYIAFTPYINLAGKLEVKELVISLQDLNSANPLYHFWSITKERCESFNKKLLELAERQAVIEYGEVEKPESKQFAQVIVYTEDGDDTTMHDKDQWLELRNFCNQCLDYIEQRELRGKENE